MQKVKKEPQCKVCSTRRCMDNEGNFTCVGWGEDKRINCENNHKDIEIAIDYGMGGMQKPVATSDNINPPHYKSSKASCYKCNYTIECIDVTRHMNFNLGNIVKYLWRADHKGEKLEQLKKAHWYLRGEIRKYDPNFDANK